MNCRFYSLRAWSLALLCASSGAAIADPLFQDNFNSGPSALWGNEVGSWYGHDGVYDTHFPNNVPTTYSTLPFDLHDFTIECTIYRIQDGGIYLRSNGNQDGVLLVTGGNTLSFTGFYWHQCHGGSVGGIQGAVGGLFPSGDPNPHRVAVRVVGNTYTCYLDGAFATSITTPDFPHGKVALYDYSNQVFDDVVVTSDNLIHGRVLLQNYTGAPTGTLNIELRDSNGINPPRIRTAVPDSQGYFTVDPGAQGVYDVWVKASHWLAKQIPSVTADGTGAYGLVYSLINGDVDGDNEVALGDFGVLSGAFGTFDGDPGFVPDADLDGDGEVGLSDFGILSSSFGLLGD